jgi:catechol 2,3-dioxygenase-like lactoylglutathione lyase family enzyme
MSPPPSGPPAMDGLDHVSLPCRDLDEGIRFYTEVLGGKKLVHEGAFAMFELWGTHIGIGSDGCTFIAPSNEYPHVGLTCNAEALVQMKDWLTACGIPSSNFWTRRGAETMMFFRDPSGNVIELYCHGGYEGAEDLPRGPAKGHGAAVDIDAIRYDSWSVPGK